jgi:hypothetical protein
MFLAVPETSIPAATCKYLIFASSIAVLAGHRG